MCLNYTCIILFFLICACTCSTCSFVVFASSAVEHGIIVLLKKSISYFINIMYKHIFHNFGVILFINKEMVSFFQLHPYKFGLVYKPHSKDVYGHVVRPLEKIFKVLSVDPRMDGQRINLILSA